MRIAPWLCAFLATCLAAGSLSACPPSSPNPPPAPLADGSPCDEDPQCTSGWCQALPGEGAVCRRACRDGCTSDEQCEALGVLEDPRHTCVPTRDTLCKRCQASFECAYPADVCVDLAGSFVCGRDCSFDGKCPPDTTCRDAVARETKTTHRQCLPSSGTCDGRCPSGWTHCDADPSHRCETNVDSDINNCGTCNKRCANSNGTTKCERGACVPTCNAGYADCDGDRANGCEANLNSDARNCGGCGKPCIKPDGTSACQSGFCPLTCPAGKADCDGNAANGCEADLMSEVNNCGACARVCTNAHGTTACSNGLCTPTCTSGFRDCDGSPNNGCETATGSDVNNCGACGARCTNAHGTTACSGGACVPSCSTGYRDCDTNPANGCETSTTTLTDCGGCSVACSRANATATCATGTCAIAACSSGYSNCDGSDPNGCERKHDNNPGVCGGTVDLGSVSGDTGSQSTAARQGYNSAWFHLHVAETSSSCRAVAAKVSLQSPPNMDFDLYVYGDPAISTCPPAPGLIDWSTDGVGALDEVIVFLCDTIDYYPNCQNVSATDDSYDLYINVRYISGAGTCGQWSLSATGNAVTIGCCDPVYCPPL